MRPLAFLLLAILCLDLRASGPATLANDSTCDISLAPAATLLLPYFEVALEDPAGETTILSITNVHASETIARVTLWTDLSYPVVTFNVHLTGHDVESISLYDVLVRGIIHTPSTCGPAPPPPDPAKLAEIRRAFTIGSIPGCTVIGNVHENAVGFATIDVVGNCADNNPTERAYYSEDLRFDNILLGDYQQVNSSQDFAQGSPMVHIRAIPEGGIPATRAILPRYQSNLPRTFYSHFQDPSTPPVDARQPLPSTFAARWIHGATGYFYTSFKIWRQSATRSATCADYRKNAEVEYTDAVAFDADENGEGFFDYECDVTCIGPDPIYLPSTSLTSIDDDDIFPQSIIESNVDGWMYLNLDDGRHGNGAPSQAWVTVSMRAEGRFSVDFDAAWLGNGCSPEMLTTAYSNRIGIVGNPQTPQPPGQILPGPAPDINP